MSAHVNLEAIRSETRKKYEPVLIALDEETTVELKPLIRLSSETRKSVLEAVEGLKELSDLESDDDDDDDGELADELATEVCDIVAKVIRLICTSPGKLLAELDTEPEPRIRAELYTSVLKTWMTGG